MASQDLGRYSYAVKKNGIVLGANEPLTVAGTVTFTQTPVSAAAIALAASGNDSLDPTKSNLFTLTPTASETINAASAPIGAEVCVVVTTSGTSSYTITFGTNFKTTGTLATGTTSGKVFTITFIGDGTNLNEIARTTAM